MLTQRDSILRLLADEDSDTAELVQTQLLSRGEAVMEDLRALLPDAKGRTERRLREMLTTLEGRVAERRFGELCERFNDEADIEEAAWALAAVELPGEDFAEARAMPGVWARELSTRLVGTVSNTERVNILSHYLGAELGFRGNEEDYYAEENSLLPRVLETKMGIPISLTLVYLAVGRRAGLDVQGVGLPGHFAARLGNVFFDPFHGGRRLKMEDCERLLTSQGLELQPHHLAPCKPRVMLARLLNNLLHLAEQEDPSMVPKLLGWLSALQRAVV